ncbi:MAG TPA: Flp family type IVb pilin [Bryobacterales bacterium]|nr:Flp family type IVb pilin [Bryobacterales bacterium]
MIKLYAKFQILADEGGQDLIEYALIVGLIALAATAGMESVAKDINNAFTNVGSKLVLYST